VFIQEQNAAVRGPFYPDGFCIVLETFAGEPPLDDKILETFDSLSAAQVAFRRLVLDGKTVTRGNA
jgi:hypothetical protein